MSKKKKKKDDRGQKKTLSILKLWRNDVGKKIWTLNFLNFSYADAPYCYTNSHSCIHHMHTASVHLCHQLWSVALCCIVMMFATLGRNDFNRKPTKKITLVNSLSCLFHVLLLCLMLTGRML